MRYSKKYYRKLAEQRIPGVTDAQFEKMWLEFCDMVKRADELQAMGIAIHPTFGRKPELPKEKHAVKCPHWTDEPCTCGAEK